MGAAEAERVPISILQKQNGRENNVALDLKPNGSIL